MKKILLTMKFWTDGQENSTRVRNVKYSWEKLKILNNFLLSNNIDSVAHLYDFSPEKILEESIHIPFELGSYMKSAKTNKIIDLEQECDFMFMFDCDTFFSERDFDFLLGIIKDLESGDFVTFDLAKLEESDTISVIENDFVDYNYNWSYAYSGNKNNGPLCCGHRGGLGGVYICDLNLLRALGGFNEKYIGWGGEDGDMIDRISSSNFRFRQKPINKIAPFHLSHFYDWSNEKYNKRFND
jgi:predicted glycosyltransferase involved in capsule biosynthesis